MPKMKDKPKISKKSPIVYITKDDGKKIIQLLTTIDKKIERIISFLENS